MAYRRIRLMMSGGDLLIGEFGNSGVQLLGGKALPIQRQAQIPQALPGQLFGPGADNVQRRNLIEMGFDIVGKRIQIVFRRLPLP